MAKFFVRVMDQPHKWAGSEKYRCPHCGCRFVGANAAQSFKLHMKQVSDNHCGVSRPD